MLRLPRGPSSGKLLCMARMRGKEWQGVGMNITHRQISTQFMPTTELYGKFLYLAKLAIFTALTFCTPIQLYLDTSLEEPYLRKEMTYQKKSRARAVQKNITRAPTVSHICNFKFSSSHMKH